MFRLDTRQSKLYQQLQAQPAVLRKQTQDAQGFRSAQSSTTSTNVAVTTDERWGFIIAVNQRYILRVRSAQTQSCCHSGTGCEQPDANC